MVSSFGGIQNNIHESGMGILVHKLLIPWIKQFE